MSGQAGMSTPRLVGGVHRDITGRIDDPLIFYLLIDRGLASGKLDRVLVDEASLFRLLTEAAKALELLYKSRSA
jgi:hypothetical protein